MKRLAAEARIELSYNKAAGSISRDAAGQRVGSGAAPIPGPFAGSEPIVCAEDKLIGC